MIKIPARIELIARISLSFLWLFTATTSFWWGRNIGYDVLTQQHIQGGFADLCINAGSIVDCVIGLWLLTGRQLTWCYSLQIILIVSYSILLSFIAPEFWLHPFGPITKNIPIIVLIFVLMKAETH